MKKGRARSYDHVRDPLARICPTGRTFERPLRRAGAYFLQAQLFGASILAGECLERTTMENVARS